MFTKKKSFYQRRSFYVALAVVLVFGFFVNQMLSKPSEEENGEIPKDSPVVQEAGTEKTEEDISTAPEEDVSAIPEGENTADNTAENYYLVKEVDGLIKVFQRDADGNEELLYNTNIAFSLISESDQNLFSEGIILSTEEELLNLLQDFES